VANQHRARIHLPGPGKPGGRLVVDDDIDLADAAVGFTLAAPDPQQLPTLTVDLVLLGAVDVQVDEARVVLPDTTREALIQLGWTPPAD